MLIHYKYYTMSNTSIQVQPNHKPKHKPKPKKLIIKKVISETSIQVQPKPKKLIIKKKVIQKPTFIEVCSGCGGLSSGFINNGFKPIFLNEINKTFCDTLEANHPGVKILNQSMEDLNLEPYINSVDILMGGVPCQSFSQAGKRKGLKDKRGNLILTFIKMIEKLNPKIFLIENVKGLKTHEKGNTLETIIEKINEIGNYNTKYQVLNANDYNVPQKRERLIIIGVRNDIQKDYQYPIPVEYKPILKDVLEDCPTSDGYEYDEKKFKVLDLVPEGGCWVNLPETIQKEYMMKSYFSGGGKRGIAKRLDMNKPSLTLLTTPSQKQTERCHPTETRPLQILEYARIQTFPDDYIFKGTLAQKYMQIGNAVPVKLGEALAYSIKKIL
jgi:DNA (cytosine-5)-methyltransferase 1